jgi:hypothetical protein
MNQHFQVMQLSRQRKRNITAQRKRQENISHILRLVKESSCLFEWKIGEEREGNNFSFLALYRESLRLDFHLFCRFKRNCRDHLMTGILNLCFATDLFLRVILLFTYFFFCRAGGPKSC